MRRRTARGRIFPGIASRAHLAAEKRREDRGVPLYRAQRGRHVRSFERDDAAVVYREQEGLHGIDPSRVSGSRLPVTMAVVRSLEVEGHGAPVPFVVDLRKKT